MRHTIGAVEGLKRLSLLWSSYPAGPIPHVRWCRVPALAGLAVGTACGAIWFSGPSGSGVHLVSLGVGPATAAAQCGWAHSQMGQEQSISYLGSLPGTISTDTPQVCSPYGNSYWLAVAETPQGLCGGNAGFAQVGWLLDQVGVNTNGQVAAGEHFFAESNGLNSDCDRGPWIYDAVSGSNGYRVDVHEESTGQSGCDAPAVADYYLNSVYELSTCVDFELGNYSKVAAEYGDEIDNYLTSSQGVTFSNLYYCSQVLAGQDCAPNTQYTVTGSNQLEDPVDLYLQLSSNSFRVCDRRYPTACE